MTVDLGGICERNENCEKSAGAVCKSGRCVCDDDYPEVDGYCLSAYPKGSAGVTYYHSKRVAVVLGNLLFLLIIYSFSPSDVSLFA